MLEPGAPAPLFDGVDHLGTPLSLAALCKRGPVVLFFYPKDFTPVCTREACFFQDVYPDLRKLDGEIVGVSIDTAESHRAFAEKHGLEFPLLSDADRALAKAYDIVRPFGLGVQRATFVIDRQGIVRGAFHHELRAKKHVEDVQALLDVLGA